MNRKSTERKLRNIPVTFLILLLYAGVCFTSFKIHASALNAINSGIIRDSLTETFPEADPDEPSLFIRLAESRESVTVTGENGWSYTIAGTGLYAVNAETGAEASVVLNGSGAFQADRTGLSMTDISLFTEENWSSQTDIEEFLLLYEGTTASGEDYSSLTPPAEPGSYSVRIIVYPLGHASEENSLSTEKLFFYQASLTEAAFTAEEPSRQGMETVYKSEDGYYQAGTAEELIYICTLLGSDVNIELTGDIVYNPISVDENGTVLSGSSVLRSWTPLGTEAEPYTGNIRGNGHTIYGLYSAEGSAYAGLIGVGQGASVSGLTLSDCVFSADESTGSAGSFAGLLLLGSSDGHALSFTELASCDCVLSGSAAGGIIGESRITEETDLNVSETTYTEKRNYLTLSDCSSLSRIQAKEYGGGIIGRLSGGTVVTLAHCLNTGKVASGYMAGGIIGEANDLWQRLALEKCVNTGAVSADEAAGGIVGRMDKNRIDSVGAEVLETLIPDAYSYRGDGLERYYGDIKISYCFSTGEISGGTYGGDILGVFCNSGLSPVYGSQHMIGCGSLVSMTDEELPDDDFENYEENGVAAWKMLSESGAAYKIKSGAGTFPAAFYEIEGGAVCGETGRAVKKCLVYGSETEALELPAHTHFDVDDTCAYCGTALTACKHKNAEYTVTGNRADIYCPDCHTTESAWISLDGELLTGTEAELLFCEGTPELSVKKSDGWDSSYPLCRLAFTDPDGKISYGTVPDDPEEFGTIKLQLYTGKIIASVKAETEAVTVTAHWHDWQYSAEGVSLHAACAHCGASASVTLEADGANAANRNAVSGQYTDYDYEIFVEDGWSQQKGLEAYYIIYDGTSVSEDYTTGIKYRAFRKPTDSGSYEARAVLLSDYRDPDTVYLETEPVSYYISAVPFSECARLYYTTAYLEDMKKNHMPEKVDGWYQVGTKEELLALIYSGDMYAKVDITADICMNPITVNEETGEVLCGSYDIYTWIPFGYVVTGEGSYQLGSDGWGFKGIIDGNGHTISGLYNWDNRDYMGLVGVGTGCEVWDLTLENCCFNGQHCGTVIGYYNAQDYYNLYLCDLSVYSSYLSSSGIAGGIVGVVFASAEDVRQIPNAYSYYLPAAVEMLGDGVSYEWLYHHYGDSDCFIYRYDFVHIFDCVSGCTVKGGNLAGGIVGYCYWGTEISIHNNTNFGRVEAGNTAGGILALIDHRWQRLEISDCVNAGYVEGSLTEGGILGAMNPEPDVGSDDLTTRLKKAVLGQYLFRSSTYESERPVYYNDTLIKNCVSVGEFGTGSTIGGIVGYINTHFTDIVFGTAAMADCYYANTRLAVGASNSDGITFSAFDLSSVMAEKLSSSSAAAEYICNTVRGYHIPEAQWEYSSALGCENERSAVKKCRICGTVLETKTVSAHSHQYISGECNFCGAEESAGTGSVFADNKVLLLPMGGLLILAAAAVPVFVCRKKRKAGGEGK